METIILAGGLGMRLRSVVSDVPKPMAPVDGKPFLEHLMDRWIRQGASRFILSVHYKRDLVQKHFGSAYRGVPVEYAVEDAPLGTGGGVLLSSKKLVEESPFFVANGDTFFAVDGPTVRRFHEAKNADLTIALHRSPEAQRYTPIRFDADGRIEALKAAPGVGPAYVNGGVYLIRRGVLESAGFKAGSKVSLEDELFPALLARGARLYGFRVDAPFIDIGVPEDYARAGAVIAAAR